MKVRVSYIVDIDDGYRRAIKHYYGEERLAARAEIQAWFEQFGNTMNDDLRHDHGPCCWFDETEE